MTRPAGIGGAKPVFSASCAFADVDADGDVDLFVTNYVDARPANNIFCGDAAKQLRIYCHPINFAPLADMLYRNNGNGTFTDVSAAAGIAADRGNGLGVVFGDYDDDGRIDLFVANDTDAELPLSTTRGGARSARSALAGRASRWPATAGRAPAWAPTSATTTATAGWTCSSPTTSSKRTPCSATSGGGLFEDATVESGVGVATLPYVGFGALFLDSTRRRPRPADRQRPRDEQRRPLPAGRHRGAAQAAVPERRRAGSREVGRQSGAGLRAPRASAARWPPATSTTTATSTCWSPTTAARSNCSAHGGVARQRAAGQAGRHAQQPQRHRRAPAPHGRRRRRRCARSRPARATWAQSDLRVHVGLGARGAGRAPRDPLAVRRRRDDRGRRRRADRDGRRGQGRDGAGTPSGGKLGCWAAG